ncbi:phosphotransferase family protein [Actinopolymorpha alba]|uniref:phosphotransferase family protein n=1 Tax=Actinopolymorpha alba TaxID=533267 RepID=UPI00035FD033|nr:phosphotransferase [Actinopolymorpha alba]
MSLGGESRRETLTAIADRYQIPFEDIALAPAPGSANDVYFLGEHLVLRIPRGAGARYAELAKEATVIPVARRAGVRTPAVATYDDSCTVVGVPYLVVERVRGRDLAALGTPPAFAADAYEEVGRSLARLHQLTRRLTGPLPGVGVMDEDDPRPAVASLAEEGYIDLDAARWLLGWFDRLAGWRPPDVEPVVLHGDASPTNIVVEGTSGRLAGLVDWGDAAWGDPALDFAKLPLRAVPFALDGYLAGVPDRVRDDAVRAWSARVLWYHLAWALHRLPQDPGARRSERVWTAPPASRLLEILRFFAESPPEPWPSLA